MLIVQILTALSAIVKTMTPELIPSTFYLPPEAEPWETRRITEGVIILTIAQLKAVNTFKTPNIYTVLRRQGTASSKKNTYHVPRSKLIKRHNLC